MLSCGTLDHDPFNTSDHLPIFAHIQLKACSLLEPSVMPCKKINWALAKKSTGRAYQNCVAAVGPLIGKSSVDDLNEEISSFLHLVWNTSMETLPLLKPSKKKKTWYNNKSLAYLAKEKKVTWDNWARAYSG